VLTSEELSAVSDFARRVRAALGDRVVDLRLFGSKARGDDDPESDLDVLIIVRPGLPVAAVQDRLVDLAFDVNLANEVYISPRVVTSDELNDPIRVRASFLGAALREGVPL
jgi:predicted nucleotidyltransferase